MGFVRINRSLAIVCLLAAGCSSGDAERKIGFDLEILNEEGLYGQADDLRSMNYEFCIPAGSYAREEVESIDPSIRCSPGQGRVGCGLQELLCIGNTQQPDHKSILLSLADLRYVTKIEQSLFE